MLNKFNKYAFTVFFILFFILSDLFFSRLDYASTSPSFVPNDYGKIIYHNKTTVFKTGIFGNSTAIAAIRDNLLPVDTGNLGIAYGKMTDFEKMLKGKFFEIDEEVIITANYLSFLDPLETNDTYPWHRKPIAPYVFFNRKVSADYLKGVLTNFINGEYSLKISLPEYYFERAVSKGHMTGEELKERIVSFDQRFGMYKIDDFSENIEALSRINEYCISKRLKTRFVWMPVNPEYDPQPEYISQLYEKVNAYLNENNIEYIDYTNSYEPENFYDLGHINWESGSYKFTEDFVKWLEK